MRLAGDGFDHGRGGVTVGGHGVVQSTVGLYVDDAGADLGRRHGQGVALLHDVGHQLSGLDLDGAPAEPGAVAVRDVCADGDSVVPADTCDFAHHRRGARMEPAGDADAGDGIDDPAVDFGDRLPFAQVGVQIDRARHPSIEHVEAPAGRIEGARLTVTAQESVVAGRWDQRRRILVASSSHPRLGLVDNGR